MSNERTPPRQWDDRRQEDRQWRDRLEGDVKSIREDVNELLEIKHQFIGGSKVVIGFVGIVTGSAGFVYLVIQLARAFVHGL